MAWIPRGADAPLPAASHDRDDVAIVTTSVNPRPAAYAAWAEQGHLIVAGDHNAPVELAHYVAELGGEYLTPEEQDRWSFSDAIGWSCIQRRNAAVMTAYERGFKLVATVDDDNIPTPGWVRLHAEHFRGNFGN